MIYNIHNIVTYYDHRQMAHRNCIDYTRFCHYLRHCNNFVDIDSVFEQGCGNVLTIDDATMGAFDAAMLCDRFRKYATLFINPYYIENGRTYYMHYLSLMIDYVQNKQILYQGEKFDLANKKKKKEFRKKIKLDLCAINDEEERIAYIEDTFKKSTSELIVPYHLRTMSIKHLRNIADSKYVRIEYHGWTHAALQSMNEELLMSEIEKSRSWLNDTLCKDFNYFCIPFGWNDHKLSNLSSLFKGILLEDKNLPGNYCNGNIVNRVPLLI